MDPSLALSLLSNGNAAPAYGQPSNSQPVTTIPPATTPQITMDPDLARSPPPKQQHQQIQTLAPQTNPTYHSQTTPKTTPQPPNPSHHPSTPNSPSTATHTILPTTLPNIPTLHTLPTILPPTSKTPQETIPDPRPAIARPHQHFLPSGRVCGF